MGRGAWAVVDPKAGSVTTSDRHSQWQTGQGGCSQVTGVQSSLDTPLDKRRCETSQGPIEGGANLFTVERDRENSQEGLQGFGDGHEP